MISKFKHPGGAHVHFARQIPYRMLPIGADEATDQPMHGVDTNTAMPRERIQVEKGPTRGRRFPRLPRSLTPIGA
jgi:hypothetical protein